LPPFLKWSFAAAGLAIALAFFLPAIVWLRAEAIIAQRYPLPSTTVAASNKTKDIRRGAHLIAIAGCADCHGQDLEGRPMVRREIMDVWSSNLRLLAHGTTDEELERAIRSGITPQSTSDWLMPSTDYSYMSEDDATAIVSYLRTLAAQGEPAPRTEFSIPVRFAIAEGDIEPVAGEVLESSASLDLGSRYDGGRYLARIGCSDCHGTDLSGSSAVPDLIDVAGYSRAQFFALLHAGRASNGRQLAIMSRPRFRAFYDYEIDALYDYLSARAKALSPRGTLSSPARGGGGALRQ
jgi:mono/diheme cytochrome c family protein